MIGRIGLISLGGILFWLRIWGILQQSKTRRRRGAMSQHIQEVRGIDLPHEAKEGEACPGNDGGQLRLSAGGLYMECSAHPMNHWPVATEADKQAHITDHRSGQCEGGVR